MSGGRGHTILYLSQGSHQRSFEDGPTSPSTTVITPQSQACAGGQCLLHALLKDGEGNSL